MLTPCVFNLNIWHCFCCLEPTCACFENVMPGVQSLRSWLKFISTHKKRLVDFTAGCGPWVHWDWHIFVAIFMTKKKKVTYVHTLWPIWATNIQSCLCVTVFNKHMLHCNFYCRKQTCLVCVCTIWTIITGYINLLVLSLRFPYKTAMLLVNCCVF